MKPCTRIATRAALGLLLALAGAGCGSAARSNATAQAAQPSAQAGDPPAPDAALTQAAAIVRHYANAPTITAQLLIRIKPTKKDAQIATVNAWSPGDGRTRLSVTRVGFSGVEALVGADGTLVAVARDGDVVRDDLRTAFADVLGVQAQPQRLIEDLKAGPLPLADAYERTATGLACLDPGTALRVEVDIAADGVTVTQKRWLHADGHEALRIDYARDQLFDGLRRAARWNVTIAEIDAEIQVRVQNLDIVPQIGDERMALAVPADREAEDLATFTRTAAPE